MAFLIASSSHDCLVDFPLYVPTILDYTVKQFFVENYEVVIKGKMIYQRNHMSFCPACTVSSDIPIFLIKAKF
jgi:hypothetical protein